MESKSSKESSGLGQSDSENPDILKTPEIQSDKTSSGSGRSDTESTDALKEPDALSDKASTGSGRSDSENPDALRPPDAPSSEDQSPQQLSDEPPFKIPRQDSTSSPSKVVSSQPGTSGEDQSKLEALPGEMQVDESKSGDSGDQEGPSLDVAICESVLKALSPFINEEQFMDTYNRMSGGYVKRRIKQAKNAEERALKGYTEQQMERMENNDEIAIRSWLKHTLPQEGLFLNSTSDDSNGVAVPPPPPPPEDDSSYSLTSGVIPSEEIQDWKAGLVCGRKILKIAQAVEKTNRKKSEYSSEDLYHTSFVCDLQSTLKEISAALGLPQTSSEPTNERLLPDIHDDDTSKGITSLRTTDSPASDLDVADLESDAGSLRRAERVADDLGDVHLSGRSSASPRNPEENMPLSGRSSVSPRNPEDDSSVETEAITSSFIASSEESSPLVSADTSESEPIPSAPPNSEESGRS